LASAVPPVPTTQALNVLAGSGSDLGTLPLGLFGAWGFSILLCFIAIGYLAKQLAAERAKNDDTTRAMLDMAEKNIPALTSATAALEESTRELGRHDK
jgi:hypothetical protein